MLCADKDAQQVLQRSLLQCCRQLTHQHCPLHPHLDPLLTLCKLVLPLMGPPCSPHSKLPTMPGMNTLLLWIWMSKHRQAAALTAQPCWHMLTLVDLAAVEVSCQARPKTLLIARPDCCNKQPTIIIWKHAALSSACSGPCAGLCSCVAWCCLSPLHCCGTVASNYSCSHRDSYAVGQCLIQTAWPTCPQ